MKWMFDEWMKVLVSKYFVNITFGIKIISFLFKLYTSTDITVLCLVQILYVIPTCIQYHLILLLFICNNPWMDIYMPYMLI